MKKLTTIFLALGIFSLIIPQVVLSQEATSSSNPSLDDVQKIRQAVQEKVAEKIKSLTTTTSNKKAYLGQISQIDNLNITIEYQNQSRLLTVDPETVFINQNRARSDISQLKVGQEILAMGLLNQSQSLDTKRIIAVQIDTLKNKNRVFSGIIVDISQTASVFSLTPFTDKDSQYQVEYDNKTSFLSFDKKAIKVTDLKPGQRLALVAQIDQNNPKSLTAIKVFQIDPPPSPTPTPSDSE